MARDLARGRTFERTTVPSRSGTSAAAAKSRTTPVAPVRSKSGSSAAAAADPSKSWSSDAGPTGWAKWQIINAQSGTSVAKSGTTKLSTVAATVGSESLTASVPGATGGPSATRVIAKGRPHGAGTTSAQTSVNTGS